MPLPQVCATFPMIVENRFVEMPPAGNPGPTTRKRFWPQLLPVTVCGEAGLPIVPGGGGTGPVAKRRNGPTRPKVIGVPNASAGPPTATGTRGLSWVKLTVPRASAWSTSTP